MIQACHHAQCPQSLACRDSSDPNYPTTLMYSKVCVLRIIPGRRRSSRCISSTHPTEIATTTSADAHNATGRRSMEPLPTNPHPHISTFSSLFLPSPLFDDKLAVALHLGLVRTKRKRGKKTILKPELYQKNVTAVLLDERRLLDYGANSAVQKSLLWCGLGLGDSFLSYTFAACRLSTARSGQICGGAEVEYG